MKALWRGLPFGLMFTGLGLCVVAGGWFGGPPALRWTAVVTGVLLMGVGALLAPVVEQEILWEAENEGRDSTHRCGDYGVGCGGCGGA